MNAIETTAILEGREHLKLANPLPETLSGNQVRVIVLFEEATKEEREPGDFQAAIGSYYRDFPDEKVRTSAEWLAQLREGDEG